MENLNVVIFFLFNQFADQSVFVNRLIVFLAVYLAYILVAAFIIGLVFWNALRAEKIKAAAAALISGVVGRGIFVEAIRFFYHHPRPFVTLSGVHQLFSETSFSFPSGHATFFFALSAVVYHYNKKVGVVFFVLSAIMGLARIAAGVHYPFDIIAGAFIGWLVGLVTCVSVEKFSPKNI